MDVIKSSGIIFVKPHDKICLKLSNDFVNYYKWFLERKFWRLLCCPKFGAHITLGLQSIHPNIDWKKAFNFKGEVHDFEYSPYIYIGGRRKNTFRNFYLKVKSPSLSGIRNALQIPDDSELHVTIANTKNLQYKSLFPKMIEIS